MISNYFNKFKGTEVAILASGKTVELYDEREDIAFAVNGACLIDKKYDVFLAGDINAPKRSWWKKSSDAIRLVSSYIAPFDETIYPDQELREAIQEDYAKFISEHKEGPHPYVYFIPSVKPQNNGYFRFGGFGIDFVQNINPRQDVMYWGGTISAIALQLALISGATKVNLYGCCFNNGSGTNYHYICPKGEEGGTNDLQQIIMQETINIVRDHGVEVNVKGYSRLR